MPKHVVCPALVLWLALVSAIPAGATDLETPAPRRKTIHAHQHGARLHLPGPVLSMRVTRGQTCGLALFSRYPNYAKASCRDYDGVLAAYDPRSPTGVGLYTFRAYYGLR